VRGLGMVWMGIFGLSGINSLNVTYILTRNRLMGGRSIAVFF